jgi:peroxin-2
MFAVPLAPTLPAFLNPKRHLTAFQTLLTRPKTVDYTSIPTLASRTFSHNEKPSRDSHSGPFADLPLTSCPICHQRRQTTPKPIGDSASAAEISLPPVEVSGGEDEEKIFVPAETDCWGGCRWCYYCIAGELARHAEDQAAEADKAREKVQGRKTETKGQEAGQVSQGERVKWDCLRCGGGVTRAWRVGSESRPEEEGDMSDGVSGLSTGSIGSSVVVI